MNTKVCGDSNHWENILLFDQCWKCQRELAPFIPKTEVAHQPLTEAEVNAMAEDRRHACTYDEFHSGTCSHPSHDYELLEQQVQGMAGCYACVRDGEPCEEHSKVETASEAYRTAN